MDLIECTKIKLTDVLNSMILPESVKDDLKGFGDNFLTIYSKKSKSLRFFPTKGEEIWWLTIAIESFSPETSGKILAKLSSVVSEFIYSTGVCISKSECFWDGIIQESAFKSPRENVIKMLKDVPNVSRVTIKAIT